MNDNLVEIKLHGELGKAIGKTWNLNVSSVAEAIHAIEMMSGRKISQYFLANEGMCDQKYEVLINDKTIHVDEELQKETKDFTEKTIEKIKESELVIQRRDLKTIDLVPVLEGNMPAVFIVIGALIVAGGIIVGGALGLALIMAGITLLAAGIINLLAKPPEIAEQRNIQTRGAVSYLFSGYENTNREADPLRIIYGRLRVGSHVVQADYDTFNVLAEEPDDTADISTFDTRKISVATVYPKSVTTYSAGAFI